MGTCGGQCRAEPYEGRSVRNKVTVPYRPALACGPDYWARFASLFLEPFPFPSPIRFDRGAVPGGRDTSRFPRSG